MTALIIILVLAFIVGLAVSSANKKNEEKEVIRAATERKKKEVEEYLRQQKQDEETQKETTCDAIDDADDENDSDVEFEGMSYDEKMKALAKRCENLLFDTVSNFEMTREEKETLLPQILSSVEQHPDETKILKAVVRKLFKTLIDRTPDLMKRVDYQERFDEEKEELRSRDYVVIDSQWNQFLDDFDDLKADLKSLQAKPQPQPQRGFGISTMETRTDEVDGQPCLVANFAVKGLFFRSPEDQDAARTLKVGDPLHMEHEEGNEKDPNAMKVTMADGHHIGYVDSKCSGYVRENQPKLLKFVVSKVDDYADPPYIYAEAFFKNE